MKETLEAEKKRLEENIKKYDDLHKESANMANTFRKQLKGIERALEVEAYKERLKSEIGERITNDNHDSCAQAFDSGIHTALTLIDTVK